MTNESYLRVTVWWELPDGTRIDSIHALHDRTGPAPFNQRVAALPLPQVGHTVVGPDDMGVLTVAAIEWDYSGGFAPLPRGVTIKLRATPAPSEPRASKDRP